MGTTCCVAGGGPAGMMLGVLLARAGVSVVVLEKHADFFRDFRGDTIHPSTLQVMDELGWLDDFLQIPHSEVRTLGGSVGGEYFEIADFRYVPGRCKFVALMPQWDFLNFLADRARAFPSFDLRMNTEATDLLYENGVVNGVRVRTPQGEQTILADLVVAADGRHSLLRQRAGLEVHTTGVPIDVMWMRLSRKADDPPQTFGFVAPGGILVALNRTTYYQIALVIAKGGFSKIQERGLDSLRSDVAGIAPFLSDRVQELQDWDQIKLLTVMIDHLRQWYRPGVLCIGDAAHAMSPIGGVGINLAIQDAVAAANTIIASSRKGAITLDDLRAVQRRREFPARLTQWVQERLQNGIMTPVLQARAPIKPPLLLRLLRTVPALRGIPALAVGVGIRPEHVRS